MISTVLQLGLALACIGTAGFILIRLFDGRQGLGNSGQAAGRRRHGGGRKT